MTDDDDLHAGVPRQSISGKAASKKGPFLVDAAVESSVQHQERLQAEECQAGIPGQRPASSIEVFPTKPLASLYEGSDRSTLDEALDNPLHWSRFFRSPFLTCVLLLVVSAFVIVVLSEALQFVQAIQASPLPLQVVAYACVGGLSIIFIWSLIRLGWTYRKLSASPQISIQSINDANCRALTRRQIERQSQLGFTSLRSIIEQYPIDDDRQVTLLLKAALSEDELCNLRSNVKYLLDSERVSDTTWLDDCERLFVNVLDKCAKQQVNAYAERVAIKTAITPSGMMDSLIVASNAVFLVEELCRIYYVRTNLVNSAFLVARLTFATFISAKLEDRVDSVAESVFGSAVASVPEATKELIAKVSLGILKRVTEGGINYAIFRRLGAAAIVSLRPIRLER